MRSATDAAVAVGRALGLPVDAPVVLHDGSNTVVHLAPAPVVARVAALTARARARPRDHLAREVALAGALAARSAPVLPPTALVDPGPHARDGHVLSLWPLVDVAGHVTGDPAVVAAALAALHETARDLDPGVLDPGGYPGLTAVVDEASGALRSGGGWLPGPARAALAARADAARTVAAIVDDAPGRRVLHGDAHPRNLLRTGAGVLWCDLEDTVAGPLEWDLAVLVRSAHHDGSAALAAYTALTGVAVDADLLAALVDVRSWQAACWSVLFADVQPARRPTVLASLAA